MTATGFVWVATVGRLLVQLRDGQSPDTWQYTSFGVVPVFSGRSGANPAFGG